MKKPTAKKLTTKKQYAKIYYRLPEGINVPLDKALGEVLERFGLTRWASGYDHSSQERDLEFEIKKK